MRLTVFGSTGRIGRLVLAEGLRRGHEITAFTRRLQLLTDTGRLAAIVTVDGRDPAAVTTAVTGADAVISIVAAGSRKGPHQTAEVTRMVADAMASAGVSRLVVTSPYPLVAEKPRLPLALLRRFLAAAYADQAEMERIVSTSDLEWTIARLNRLTDKPGRGRVEMSTGLLDKASAVTRADAATVVLDLVADHAYARAAVNVSGA
jgi:putative NADH-flavin reductase